MMDETLKGCAKGAKKVVLIKELQLPGYHPRLGCWVARRV